MAVGRGAQGGMGLWKAGCQHDHPLAYSAMCCMLDVLCSFPLIRVLNPFPCIWR